MNYLSLIHRSNFVNQRVSMRMFKYILICCVAVLALYYYPKIEERRHKGEERIHVLETTDAKECGTMGGHIQPVCLSGEKVCLTDYTDAGKACSSSTECQGKCVYAGPEGKAVGDSVMGQCEENNNPCGCWQLVEKGELHAQICAD